LGREFNVTEDVITPIRDGPKLPFLTRIAYGLGSVAYGVKDNGFGFFLLGFYGTVIGIDPRLVGLAMLIVLLFDAISDPVVGYISDNWRSKWGRRHPFMYCAAIPVSVSFYFLWVPPDWSEAALFWYLVVVAALIRTFITLYTTPSSALLPELASDYDERATLQAYRLYFGWTGGNAMALIGFGLIFVATPEFEDGLLNRAAYAEYGLLGSVLIFAAIMISSLGTHNRIKTLRPPPPKRKLTLSQVFAEIFETLGERSFTALFVATLFGGIASGLSAALSFLLLTFFWGFSGPQIFIWLLFVMLSAVIGFVVAPAFVRWFGKKRAVILLGVFAFGAAPLPIVLRLIGVFPENGDPALYPLVLTINTIDVALIIALQAVLYSMIADLVEVSELKTGRRSEGIFYAAVTFIRKSAQGFGGAAAGFVLAYANMPKRPEPSDVSADMLFRMGLGYAPTLWILWSLMLIAIGFYKIDREAHNRNLAELAAKRVSQTP
jgi:Na+/melibiose symporter-like transporter